MTCSPLPSLTASSRLFAGLQATRLTVSTLVVVQFNFLTGGHCPVTRGVSSLDDDISWKTSDHWRAAVPPPAAGTDNQRAPSFRCSGPGRAPLLPAPAALLLRPFVSQCLFGRSAVSQPSSERHRDEGLIRVVNQIANSSQVEQICSSRLFTCFFTSRQQFTHKMGAGSRQSSCCWFASLGGSGIRQSHLHLL